MSAFVVLIAVAWWKWEKGNRHSSGIGVLVATMIVNVVGRVMLVSAK